MTIQIPNIRAERVDDVDAIASVVAAAFGSPIEAQLVADIRASPEFVPAWSLVAELDGVVVGHVLVSYVRLVDDRTERRVPSLSPLAVDPAHQQRGIGTALVRRAIDIVDEAAQPLVVLEGDPGFYGRLGFEYSVPHGIRMHLPDWAPPTAAQVALLRAYDARIRGTLVYPQASLTCIAAEQAAASGDPAPA